MKDKADIIFGKVEIRSWLELLPNGTIVGMGMIQKFDKEGKLTECKIEPTGISLSNLF